MKERKRFLVVADLNGDSRRNETTAYHDQNTDKTNQPIKNINEVASNNGVRKSTRVLRRIPRRNINYVRFHHHRTGDRRMESRNRSVVRESVFAADNAETDDVAFFVEDLESFRTVIRRKT
ncbi:hypothetical protein G4B88_001578 [Cannabis sativa]|uniref:Uncharacterized protein n=1 Tax=Cannabis sativa TaxID=3483 RepID=A0A7J6I1F2_CANSA|nr:hypothetical protein G4B88_001578 [Cannabis sativa]